MLYVPGSFRESDVAVMQEFMRRYPFATVDSYRDGIHVSHLLVETKLANLVFEVPKEGDVAASSFRLR